MLAQTYIEYIFNKKNRMEVTMRVEQREKRKLEIIITSIDVFVTRGYAGTKIQDIAESAGMSVGLLFHYFESKEALYNELIKIAVDGTMETLNQDAAMPIEYFEKLTRDLFMKVNNHPYWAKIFVLLKQAMNNDSIPEIAKKYVRKIKIVERMVQVIKSGQQLQIIRRGNSTTLAMLYWTTVTGIIEQYAFTPSIPLPEVSWILSLIKPT